MRNSRESDRLKKLISFKKDRRDRSQYHLPPIWQKLYKCKEEGMHKEVVQ